MATTIPTSLPSRPGTYETAPGRTVLGVSYQAHILQRAHLAGWRFLRAGGCPQEYAPNAQPAVPTSQTGRDRFTSPPWDMYLWVGLHYYPTALSGNPQIELWLAEPGGTVIDAGCVLSVDNGSLEANGRTADLRPRTAAVAVAAFAHTGFDPSAADTGVQSEGPRPLVLPADTDVVVRYEAAYCRVYTLDWWVMYQPTLG